MQFLKVGIKGNLALQPFFFDATSSSPTPVTYRNPAHAGLMDLPAGINQSCCTARFLRLTILR